MIYRESLALLTDLYQLTMAYGYWKAKIHNQEAVFHLIFRKYPFKGMFALAAGLESVIDFIQNFQYSQSDLDYLHSLKTSVGKPLFEEEFLDYLSHLCFSLDVDAPPEGTLLFPHEPLIRVKGPILQAQLVESSLLNLLNFQTLIATKSARICLEAFPAQVIEFGMRRAQGIDGAISASRAAFIGGCEGTSHVLAGKLFQIPVRGTQAHSWVMAFKKEEEAFATFLQILPDNCFMLIDTYDSIEGVKKAMRVAKKTKQKLFGVRLDSGDLAYLSCEIRKLLDREGFFDTKIMASNELDEFLIRDLKQQGAKIDVYGVGTHLVTGKDQPALDGVYKLSAIRTEKGEWENKVKISEQTVKTTTPGVLQVRRFFDQNHFFADAIFDEHRKKPSTWTLVDTQDSAHQREIPKDLDFQDLLVPIFRSGKCVYTKPALLDIRLKAKKELERMLPVHLRLMNPQSYLTGFEKTLFETKRSLIKKLRRES
jgi:nicotinate phosphoribosyltransferase